MLAVGDLHVLDVARGLGIDFGIAEMTNALTRLGFNASASRLSMLWTLPRIALRFGVRTPAGLDDAHVNEMLAAIRRFGERADVGLFWGSAERYRVSPAKA